MARARCSNCNGWALILAGKMACCGAAIEPDLIGVKRMSQPPESRRGPSKRARADILERQRFECFYCHRRFGSAAYRGRRRFTLRIEWDHVEPYSYGLDGSDQNFVAACHVCNSLKGAKIFQNYEEAEVYLAQAWERTGHTDCVPVLRETLHP
jgi:5-methylcytosine-specific restriction endonuclease McrA